ncbi:hypothetical protein, partial [Rathayibacter tritici]|uniref:hypothetical protein n=1 Tax=Rathayibacter tritici TaxID=33888 RepID=UPI001CA50E76
YFPRELDIPGLPFGHRGNPTNSAVVQKEWGTSVIPVGHLIAGHPDQIQPLTGRRNRYVVNHAVHTPQDQRPSQRRERQRRARADSIRVSRWHFTIRRRIVWVLLAGQLSLKLRFPRVVTLREQPEIVLLLLVRETIVVCPITLSSACFGVHRPAKAHWGFTLQGTEEVVQLNDSRPDEIGILIELGIIQDSRDVEDATADNDSPDVTLDACDISTTVVRDFTLHVEFVDFITDLLHGEEKNLVLDLRQPFETILVVHYSSLINIRYGVWEIVAVRFAVDFISNIQTYWSFVAVVENLDLDISDGAWWYERYS